MKTKLDKADKIWEAVAILLLLVQVIVIAIALSFLPDTIPIHFNGAGRPNGWGSKYTIWFTAALSLFIYALTTLISLKPGLYKYRMSQNNLEAQYRLTSKMARTMKAFILLAFFILTLFMIQNARGQWNAASPFLFLIFFALIVTPALYYVAKLSKLK